MAAPKQAAQRAQHAQQQQQVLEATGVAGVQRVRRRGAQPRRSARVEYAVACGAHPSYRLDRVGRLVEYFGAHVGCRRAPS